MSQIEIVHAYRHILRQSLRAVQFSRPSRYTLRDRLRQAFRKGKACDFNPERIKNTLTLLKHATETNGLEHKILKSLLFVWWDQDTGANRRRGRTIGNSDLEIKTTAYDAFNHTIDMLNESMHMCIPRAGIREYE